MSRELVWSAPQSAIFTGGAFLRSRMKVRSDGSGEEPSAFILFKRTPEIVHKKQTDHQFVSEVPALCGH